MSTDHAESTFYFRAATPDGGIYAGTIRAATVETAARQLVEKGFQPLRLGGEPLRIPWFHREIGIGLPMTLGPADCELICRELALLLSASVTIVDTLAIAASSMPKASRTARFLTMTRHGMRLGRPLSTAMEFTGFRLPPNFLPVVRAGEQAGSLASALALLSENYSESQRFSRAVSAALAYPLLLLLVSLMVFGLMAFFVAPSLQSLFVSMSRPVPAPIMILAGLASFIETHLILIGITLAGLVLGLSIGGRRAVSRGLKRIALRLPVIGTVVKWAATRQFAATLHLYLTSGLSIASALCASHAFNRRGQMSSLPLCMAQTTN